MSILGAYAKQHSVRTHTVSFGTLGLGVRGYLSLQGVHHGGVPRFGPNDHGYMSAILRSRHFSSCNRAGVRPTSRKAAGALI